MDTHRHAEFSTGHQYLEVPRWHEGHLYASDFFAKHVLRFTEDGTCEVIAEIETRPAGLGFLDDGSILVVSQEDKKVVRIKPNGTLTEHGDFSNIAGGIGNDMLVSPSGHAYVGNLGFNPAVEDAKPTHLAHIDPLGTVSQVDGELMVPNGMALTPDGKTLLVAETFTHRISAFDVNEDGSLSNLRLWAQLADEFHPDGLAADSDGGVWFGNAMTLESGSGFYRILEGGEITDKVPVENAWAVACQFGGSDLDTLYLMCSKTNFSDYAAGVSTSYAAKANVGRRGFNPAG